MATRSPERDARMRRRAEDEAEEGEDDQEFVVTGEELKKLVRLGRKRPMPFAFCPSAGDEPSLFATHRKKPPKKIARATKEDSGQTKVAYGTFVILDRVMVLTCERELPAIAKKLKKHMRAERLPLNIRVLDAAGREVESDIEDLTAEDDPFAEGEDEDDDDASGADREGDRFRDRLDLLGKRVAAAGDDGAAAEALLTAARRALDNGSRDKAQKLATELEAEVRRLNGPAGRSARRPSGPAMARGKPPEPDKSEAAAPEPGVTLPDKAEAVRLARRIAALRPRAGALAEPASGKLTAALALVARRLRSGRTDTAEAALDDIEAALLRVEARAAG